MDEILSFFFVFQWEFREQLKSVFFLLRLFSDKIYSKIKFRKFEKAEDALTYHRSDLSLIWLKLGDKKQKVEKF